MRPRSGLTAWWQAPLGLPKEFQSRLENVVVLIQDDPPEDMPGTLGLYEGVPLTERTSDGISFPGPDNVVQVAY